MSDRLKAMEAFARVVDAGSFSAAARRWGCSKAAVSKYVASLEAHLGVALLARTTRSSSLTEAGRAYHRRCVDLLAEVEALEASLRDDHAEPRGLLRVTAPPGLAERQLMPLSVDFIKRYPRVKLELELTHRMVDLVEEGYDLAVRATRPRDSSLVVRRLAPAPVIAVAAPSYLDRAGTPAHPKELGQHACLVDSNFRDGKRWRFEVDGEDASVTVDGPVKVNSPMAIRDLAVAGLGIALSPDFVVERELATGALVEILPNTVALGWSIVALYPRRDLMPGRLRAYLAHLVEAFD